MTTSPITPSSDQEPAIVRTAAAYYRGQTAAADLLAAFRDASLHVHRTVSPAAVPVVHIPGAGQWIQVYSTLERLGAAVGAEHYLTCLGAELLDLFLPALPRGTGVLLDAGTPHMIAFPPVEPIVAAAIALTYPEAV